MSRERGQALVEATLSIPICIVCALALVDGGLLVRDRIATSQAATRAAEAHLAGGDVQQAATSAVPGALQDSVRVDETGDAIVVRTSSRTALSSIAGRRTTHSSRVELVGSGASR